MQITIYTQSAAQSSNHQQLHQQQIINRYFNTLEGKQARFYRQNLSNIATFLPPSAVYQRMTGTITMYNLLLDRRIVGLRTFELNWRRTRTALQISAGLGSKYHYLSQCVEYIRLWRIGIGYINEQSIENYQKTFTNDTY